jgi:hypothetical protein
VVVAVALDGPSGVTIEGQGSVDVLEFGYLVGRARGEKVGVSSEGEDGGTFVMQWLVGVPGDVLVCVGRLRLDVKF